MIIQTVAVIAICSIGLGANFCALFVLLNSSIIKSTTGIYLSFLAVFDGLVLVTQLVFSFSNVINLSNIACKLFWIVRVPVITISCYILVIMTTEKCYFLVNTYKPKPTRKQAIKIATASAIVITLVLGTQVGITSGLVSLPVDGTFGNSSNYIALDNNFPIRTMAIKHKKVPPHIFLPLITKSTHNIHVLLFWTKIGSKVTQCTFYRACNKPYQQLLTGAD